MRTAIIVVSCLILAVCLAFGIYCYIEKVNHDKLLAEYSVHFPEWIGQYSKEYNLDPYLVLSIMRCESSFDSDALSDRGAMGLMQIMPDTGTWIAHKQDMDDTYTQEMLNDPETNIRFACWYLNFLNNRLSNNKNAVICAYNAGHKTVQQWLENPEYVQNGEFIKVPFPQTERYLEKVTKAYEQYTTLYPELFK